MARRGIVRYETGTFSHDPRAELAEEAMLHVEINETASFDVVVTPQHIREFVVGYLICEGYAADASEITKMRLNAKDRIARADVTLDSPRVKTLAFRKNYNIIWTECGTADAFYRMLGEKIPSIKSKVTITPVAMFRCYMEVLEHNDAYRRTGAYHYAFLFDPKTAKVVAQAIDIGRHNAIDKVVGLALSKGLDPSKAVLFSTGRITIDMILKAARARIPIVISRSAPLDKAVELAAQFDLTLVGFLRNNRFNIYAAPQRIETAPGMRPRKGARAARRARARTAR
ncbi:MAG TPA: formate dehydrogenase accessory sulfurtransferase FdhD [Candidatus Thermoplasmatota archaeon]|nr:formate dehydrogenase accessory sulfurtransferase FdhD [Candidatus Thermoplasmatota archaeon]